MIPQLVAPPTISLAPGSPGSGSAASLDAVDAAESSFGDLFGDLLGDLPGDPTPGLPPLDATFNPAGDAEHAEEPSETVAAGILALLSDLELAPETGLVPGTGALQIPPGEQTPGEEQLDPLHGLWALLSEGRRPVGASDAAGRALTAASGAAAVAVAPPLDASISVAMDSRPGALETMLPGSTGGAVSPASTLPPGALEALQALTQSGPQPATADTGGGTLAAALSASASDRSLETAMGRPLPGSPLSTADMRATVSQTLEQVAWMSREGVHAARLQLEPAHLGRVDIWLDVEGNETRLHLGAQQAHVREALEAVLPRLRDALAEQGMNLMDASVSHSGRDETSGEADRGDASDASIAGADDTGDHEHEHDILRLHSAQSSGMLNIYA